MTDRSGGLMIPHPALLLAMLLIVGALAACSGGDTPTPRPQRAATAEPEATQEAASEPTRQGVLGRVGSQPTSEPEATEEAGGVMSRLGGTGSRDGRETAGGSFSSFSVGVGHACGVKADGAVLCFGRHNNTSPGGRPAAPPEGTFVSVATGEVDSCGLKPDGSVVCWGRFLPVAPLAGSFESISVGKGHVCGLTNTGAVVCSDDDIELPEGQYTQISSEYRWGCGVNTDQSIACRAANTMMK